MCGICGLVNPSGVELKTVVEMNMLASYRGPDGEGYWLWGGESATGHFIESQLARQGNQRGTIGLGHRRLAILDLSDAGLQPMPSNDKQIWIVFNGEIYNYLELRDELVQLGYEFHTATDTEVILAAYNQWGDNCFIRFNGMWGIVIVDLRKRMLVFSRDRLGIKPLYIWVKGQTLAFASEIKQFRAVADFKPVANMDAIAEYVDTGYQLPPTTFFQGVQEFPAGCWAEVPIDKPGHPAPQAFWHPEDLRTSKDSRVGICLRLRNLLKDSIRLRLRSDVPVGVCLSGGLDSSSIFCQIQYLKDRQSSPTPTFSAVFGNTRLDERKYMEIVLRTFSGKGYYTFPSPEIFLDDFDNFIFHQDEPPCSLSQYAGWSVMRLAQKHQVPVVLSGQGGDELFSGYWPAYYFFIRQQRARFVRTVTEHLVGALLPGGNYRLLSELPNYLHRYWHRKGQRNRAVLMRRWRSAGFTLKENWALVAQQLAPVQYRIYELRRIHIPRLLKWDDRNSMAFGVEARYPLLDYRLVDLALTAAPKMNMRQGWNKLLLRQALDGILPPAIQWRKTKIGFEVPQSEWVRTGLRPLIVYWAAHPSERLQQIIDKSQLKQLTDQLMRSKVLLRMDERLHLLIRLFFLDRWLNIFKIDL